MGDWSKPNTGGTDLYTTILGYINDRLNDVATMFSSAPSNQPDKTVKWVRASSKFQEYSSSGASWSDLSLSVAGGGTGAATAADARTNLGLGTMATQSSNAVSITAGSMAAAVVDSGTIGTARLGSGVANGSSFLRGDQSWQAVPSGVPTGYIGLWGTAVAPSDYLLCNGAAVSRTTYSALFSVIGVTYGIGDNSTTFNVPDLRGKFPIGVAASGTGSTLAGTGGSIDHTHSGGSHYHSLSAHTHTYSEVVNHTHPVNITDAGHSHDYDSPDGSGYGGSGGGMGSQGGTTSTETTGITATTSNPSGGVASGTTAGPSTNDTSAVSAGTTGTNNPPFLALNFIIKT